jgi:tRNA-dihydrouridine synthase B
MIGRGSYGRPWFIQQVIHYLNTGEHLPDPSLEEQLAIIRLHYHDMLEHYGIETGVRMARKHLGWYSSGMPSSAEFRSKINRLSDPMAVEQLVVDFYQAQMVAACQEKILT